MLTTEQLARANAIKTKISTLVSDKTAMSEEMLSSANEFQAIIDQVISQPVEASDWNDSTIYFMNNIVKYEDKYYKAKLLNSHKNPKASFILKYWEEYDYAAAEEIPEWSSYATAYLFTVGTKVKYLNKIYKCKAEHKKSALATPLNLLKWEEV